MDPNVHCSTVNNSQDKEATQMYTDRGMDKEDAVHIHGGMLLTVKKNKTPFAAKWMDQEIVTLSEVSQTEKEKCHMTSLICGI